MQRIKIAISVITLLFITQYSLSQSITQEKADYFFSQFSYAKAVPEYEKMLKGNNVNYAHQRLAECHLMMRNIKQAIPHFEIVMSSSTPPPPDLYFKYSMALYSTGDTKGATKWLKVYKKLNKNDSRVKKFLKNGTLASVVFSSRERYDLEPVSFNSTFSDFGAYVKDGVIYFSSARAEKSIEELYGWNDEPWLDIFMVNEDADIAEPTQILGNINSNYHESSMVFSTDYKNDTVIYFTRNSYFKNKKSLGLEDELNLKIFSAIKESGEWKVNRDLSINSETYSTGHPYVTSDRKRIYFTSDRPGGYGGADIYYAPIHDRGGIGTPINAGPIVNTEGDEMFPFLNSEGQLFFSSDGHVGFGQVDIFSTISNEEGKIVDVINLGNPINSSADDFGYFEHENGGTGYISSNREGGVGSDDIYKFIFTPSLSVEGIVIDAVNLQPLDNVTISIYDQGTNTKVAEILTDKSGHYKSFVSRNNTYMIEAVRKTHPHKSIFFNTSATNRSTKLIQKNITLEPVLDLKILADLDKIYFDFNKSDIRPDAAIELNKVVKLMTVTYPEMVIRLESHTDPVGSHNYNNKLSQKRAKSTYEYLIKNGVPDSRILSYKGFGKTKTINGCTGKSDCTDAELELNRRTEFPIIQIKGDLSQFNATIAKKDK